MNWLQRYLDKKLQFPMSYTMRGDPRKDPSCKSLNCDRKGRRTDMRLGKLLGGGTVWCNCCIIESDTKDRLNKFRRWAGLPLFNKNPV